MAATPRLTESALAQLVPAGSVVIAVTDDGSDPHYAAVRDAATTIAAGAGARVLLFHAPPGRADSGRWRWRVFVPGLRGPGSVAPHEADPHGASLLDVEATAIRARGVEVAVWMTSRPILAGMVEAVSVTDAALVLMPAEAERRGIVRRTLDYRASRIPAPVVAVDPDGGLMRVRPLGARPVESGKRARIPRRARLAGPADWGFSR